MNGMKLKGRILSKPLYWDGIGKKKKGPTYCVKGDRDPGYTKALELEEPTLLVGCGPTARGAAGRSRRVL